MKRGKKHITSGVLLATIVFAEGATVYFLDFTGKVSAPIGMGVVSG